MRKMLRIILLGLHDVGGRKILSGIHSYLHGRQDWDFRISPYFFLGGFAKWMNEVIRAWRPDGIIAGIRAKSLLNSVIKLEIPTVNVSGIFDYGPPQVISDNIAVGRAAAGHFLERGLRNVACIQLRANFSRQRCEGLRSGMAERGGWTSVHVLRPRKGASDDSVDKDPGISPWLHEMPRPFGLMANYDYEALQLAWCCQHLGLRVPDDVSILGIDNDEQLCKMRSISLSSIDTQPWKIGFEAARMLHGLIAGKARKSQPVLIPPLRVVSRQSTSILATDDAAVVAAAKLIRDSGGSRVGVKDLVRHVAISRRSLERRFSAIVGRSLHDEIDRVHLERAKDLLSTTNLKIAQVARSSGFGRHESLCVFFKRQTGLSPAEYRLRTQHIVIPELATDESA